MDRKIWQRLLNRLRRLNVPSVSAWRVQSLFVHYRRILEINNSALEEMSALEGALGGAYIFDRAFLERSVRRLSALVHHVTYNLNALTGNAHVALYDRFQEIRSQLHHILAGDPPPEPASALIPFAAIEWDLEPIVGFAAVCLAELHKRYDVPIMHGFVVSTPALRLLHSDPAPAPTSLSTADDPAGVLRRLITTTALGISARRGATSFSVVLQNTTQPLAAPAALRSNVAADDLAAVIVALLAATKIDMQAIEQTYPVVLVQEDFPEQVGGRIDTRARVFDDDTAPSLEVVAVTAADPAAPASIDRYWARWAHPFDLAAAAIPSRTADQVLPDGRRPTNSAEHGLLRGSALLTAAQVRDLTEKGLLLERLFGSPCSVTWRRLPDGRVAVARVAPLNTEHPDAPLIDLAGALAQAHIICRGGHTVQAGVAAGQVVHVDETTALQTLPNGAIVVAPNASPRLAPLLIRAGAVLTGTGTATGHLATVVREMRLPGVFGIPDLLTSLSPGTPVTVDAAEQVVYAGVVDELLQSGGAGAELEPSEPEYRQLRRLLRWIQPLRLLDPQSVDFIPQKCLSYHDILHYCHEQAVNELAHLQERRPGIGKLRARRLETEVPLPIRVLDIGGGIAPSTGEILHTVDIRSTPLRAFLEGLRRPEAWQTAPSSLGVRDIAAGMLRTAQALNTPPQELDGNLAIAGADYLNLSLRLGYHFSVIDALLGEDPQRSYVYFRFVGGLADARRRERRAHFIHEVLSVLDFNVTQNGDLVAGRLKWVPLQCQYAALHTLGALTAFSRQRDTAMQTDSDTTALFELFASRFIASGPKGKRC